MNESKIPVSLIGAGTQPAEEDGASLDILQLPDEMQTFSMPQIETERLTEQTEAMAIDRKSVV